MTIPIATTTPEPWDWMLRFLGGDTPAWPANSDFLDHLLVCAKGQRARVLMIEQLLARQRKLVLPETLICALGVLLHQEVALEMLRQEEVGRVVEALADAGLSCLLFKGTPLAYSLYPEACLRDRSDTDLLLASLEDAEQAWRVVQGLGYDRMNTAGGVLTSYQFPCSLRGGPVAEMLDVHWGISNDATLRVFSFEELWAGSINVPALGAAARAPCHAHALVLACLHRLGHVKDGEENKLIWLYDIYLLLQALDGEQWQSFMSFARDKGVGGPCCDGVEQAAAAFGAGPEPVSTMRLNELRLLATLPGQQLVVAETLLARDIAQLRSAPGLRRLQLLREYLFPAVAYMQARYQPPWRGLLPFYYIWRLVHGSGRRIRKHFTGAR